MRWPKYWSFSFSISPSNKHQELISFRMDWLDPLESKDVPPGQPRDPCQREAEGALLSPSRRKGRCTWRASRALCQAKRAPRAAFPSGSGSGAFLPLMLINTHTLPVLPSTASLKSYTPLHASTSSVAFRLFYLLDSYWVVGSCGPDHSLPCFLWLPSFFPPNV